MNLWFNKEKMYTANDIAKRFEKIAPLELGLAGDELGFVHGEPETQVTGPANSISIPTANVRNFGNCLSAYGVYFQRCLLERDRQAENNGVICQSR